MNASTFVEVVASRPLTVPLVAAVMPSRLPACRFSGISG